MLKKFYKMQGIGNDYIYFDCLETPFEDPSAAAVRLSDRHFGIGGDGIVLICPSAVADAKMRMFNADGSEGKMCGNAIRCVGKYLYDFRKTDKTQLKIETLSGIKTLFLSVSDGETTSVRVDMGAPELAPKNIPVLSGTSFPVVGRETEIAGGKYAITCVSMGNPHCVVFSDPDAWEIEKTGPMFENAPIFPERTNTEFVKVLGKNELKMRVWERGSGETWACGTGACAAAVACILNGYCKRNTDIKISLRGGELSVKWSADGNVYLTGSAQTVFTGEIAYGGGAR